MVYYNTLILLQISHNMSKPSLVILAAGMASRYGSQKQTEGFGPNGETIMDYSIYDAIAAGFSKIIFIIRKDFAAEFEAQFNQKLTGKCEIAYVYQAIHEHTQGYTLNEGRTKPWGTGHALLCASQAIDGAFAVINADDFYGKDAFVMAYRFLLNDCTPSSYAIVGYELKNTLSANGTVSRGVCVTNNTGHLQSVTERTKVYSSNYSIVYQDGDQEYTIPNDARASMNFWCFDATVLDITATLFHNFMLMHGQEPKSEFFLTNIGDYAIRNNVATITVLPTSAQWFGVTYKEDAPVVAATLTQLIANGVYPSKLW